MHVKTPKKSYTTQEKYYRVIDMRSTTGFISSYDKIQLFFRYYEVTSKKATLLIIHGFGEHSGRYSHVIDQLCHQNYEVICIDLRGHGKSAGPRGHILNFDQFEQDVYTGLQFAQTKNPTKLFIIAHSMGALVSLRVASTKNLTLNGLVLSAPLFNVKVPIPAWKKLGAHVLSGVFPALRVTSNIQASDLSSDQNFVLNYDKDPLILKNLSINTFVQITKSYKNIVNLTNKFKTPIFLQLAGNDRVVDSTAAKNWFNIIKKNNTDSTLKCYTNFLHEIYNEKEREKPIQDCISWLNKRS